MIKKTALPVHVFFPPLPLQKRFYSRFFISSKEMSDRSAWEGLGTWSAPGELAPYTVIPEIDEDQVKRLSHTQGYGDLDEFLVTRRDTTFPVNLKTRARLIVESATLNYNAQNKVSLKLGKQTTRVYGTSVEVSRECKSEICFSSCCCMFCMHMLTVFVYSHTSLYYLQN